MASYLAIVGGGGGNILKCIIAKAVRDKKMQFSILTSIAFTVVSASKGNYPNFISISK